MLLGWGPSVHLEAQEPATHIRLRVQPAPAATAPATPEAGDCPLPINLPTALCLANARPLDILLAQQRTQVAAAQLRRARALWLPTVYLGTDYTRHDGQIQDVQGRVFGTSKSSFLLGAGPGAVFAFSDAIYAPLAARQVVRARRAEVQAALNDSLLAVAESYFTVQQARGELAGALDALRRSEDLLRRVEELARNLAPELEVFRARTERDQRIQAVEAARERWRTASAELARLLRLAPSALVDPLEPPQLRVELIDLKWTVDELIPVALRSRPELATQQALVEATLRRLQQERMRPLVPSLLVRGNATNPGSPLAGGLFGGGLDSDLSHFSVRNSIDVQVLWELQNLGFGNRALVRERRAENELAVLELLRTEDRVAAEVADAHARARSAAARAEAAESALRNAVESANRNLEGVKQTRVGPRNVLLVRPQEAVAAVQALALAYAAYYGAVADANRAQFRLYRALGEPAQQVCHQLDQECAGPAPAAGPPAPSPGCHGSVSRVSGETAEGPRPSTAASPGYHATVSRDRLPGVQYPRVEREAAPDPR
jgi:outer membrane protein TolC